MLDVRGRGMSQATMSRYYPGRDRTGGALAVKYG
jgi:hypothetical protein